MEELTKVPESYYEQDGCYNCSRVFERIEHGECPEYYCTFNAPERPLCMSRVMKEYPDHLKKVRDISPYYRAWNEWSEGRQVSACGICNNYK